MKVKVEKHPAEKLLQTKVQELHIPGNTFLVTPTGLKLEPLRSGNNEGEEFCLDVRFGAYVSKQTVKLDIHNLKDDHLVRFSSSIEQPAQVKNPAAAFYTHQVHFSELFEKGLRLNDYCLAVLEN